LIELGGWYAFFSAAYAVREGRWNDVSIQILHHPNHAWNADRMVRSVQAPLDYYTQQFSPYPHGQVMLVEHPGGSVVLHVSPVNISYADCAAFSHKHVGEICAALKMCSGFSPN